MEGNEHANIRREFIEKLEFLSQKGFEQAYQLDKSLLTLSAAALGLSVTFVGTLAETKQCLHLLFIAWACFIVSIMAVTFAMRRAQVMTHRDALKTAHNLERLSQMTATERALQRATFSAGTNKLVVWLNRIAVLGFVLGVGFLCWFVGSNLLANWCAPWCAGFTNF